LVAIVKVVDDGFFGLGFYFISEDPAFEGTFPFAHLGLTRVAPHLINVFGKLVTRLVNEGVNLTDLLNVKDIKSSNIVEEFLSLQENVLGILPPNRSVYEGLAPFTTLTRMHFLEWFSGAALDFEAFNDIWSQHSITGTGTFGMADGIDLGFSMKAEDISNGRSTITHGGLTGEHFDMVDMIWHGIFRRVPGAAGDEAEAYGGMTAHNCGILGTSDNSAGSWEDRENATNKQISHNNGVFPRAFTDSGVPKDRVFHHYEIDFKSGSLECSMDGDLKVTVTLDTPSGTDPGQPAFEIVRRINATEDQEMQITFVECFNK